MPKLSSSPRRAKQFVPRKRRTADEARTEILDAAERLLVATGPGGIRLQEVAASVGVSHPTVLHHFGSREALIEAVVARALDSLHAGLLAALRTAPERPQEVEAMLGRVFDTLVAGGHARAFLWLALSGYAPTMEELRIRKLAEAVHEVRRTRRAGKRRMPPFEDTYFTVMLPALAVLALSVFGPEVEGTSELCGPVRFRAWLARLVHEHLENR
jgi:AcrR family transcriptional regulator